MKKKSVSGDRGNNLHTIRSNIERVRQNIEFSEELMAETSDEAFRTELEEKNRRRARALEEIKHEFTD